jgi:hypothetical protein
MYAHPGGIPPVMAVAVEKRCGLSGAATITGWPVVLIAGDRSGGASPAGSGSDGAVTGEMAG